MNTFKKSWLLWIIPLILLILIGLAILLNLNSINSNIQPTPTTTPMPTPEAQYSNCTDNLLMTHTPINIDSITSIAPLGNLNPQGGHIFPTEHIYYYLKKPNNSLDNIAPLETLLFAPATMWITAVIGSEHLSESPAYTDYNIEFVLCDNLKGSFGHVSTITDSLKAQLVSPYDIDNTYTAGGKNYRHFSKTVKILINAGEQIGTVGGRIGQNALDMSFYDYTKPALNYANNSRWSLNSRQLYVSCPLNYFVPELRRQMESKLGKLITNTFYTRTQEPICGEANQDISGTAQGVWFLKDTQNTYPEDPHLALVHDNYNPAIGVFSVGNSLGRIGVQTNTYAFSPTHSGLINRDFAEVTPDGNIYCYEINSLLFGTQTIQPNPTFIIQMTSTTTLKVGKLEGKCENGPWTMTNSVDYER